MRPQPVAAAATTTSPPPLARAPAAAVLVTSDRVVAPPERFISVTDDTLISYFSGALAGCGNASQLPALFALMEGVCQHEYLGMRRRLEADFALFADAGRGVRPGGGAAAGRPLKRLSSIEAHERRFLTDFISAMFSAHYRLLGKEEWEAAASEAFLFTLPVTVDWGALDRRMLQRYWGDHPEQRAELPDLSDRILIFCRGFEPARMRGRYLWHKIELLLQFFLLSPLWAGVVWALQQVGLRAPPPPPLAGGMPMRPGEKPEVAFKGVAAAARAACKWRHVGQGELGGDESLMHDAASIIERVTMSRVFPSGRAVLQRMFHFVELQEACIRDVVVLYRRKTGKGQGGGQGEKEVIREVDASLAAHNIHLKRFSAIPLADLEMVMPEKKVFVPPSVLLQLAAAVVVAVAGLVATLFSRGQGWAVWGPALLLLASRASAVYAAAASERNEIEREMNKLLFERTEASQEAVLHTLTDEMCRHHIRECFLAYCCLLQAGRDLSAADLDARCERLLHKRFALRVDFSVEDALRRLCRWGLVARQPDGRLQAQPLQDALVALDGVWDGIFQFGGGAQGTQAAGGSAAGGAPGLILAAFPPSSMRGSDGFAAACTSPLGPVLEETAELEELWGEQMVGEELEGSCMCSDTACGDNAPLEQAAEEAERISQEGDEEADAPSTESERQAADPPADPAAGAEQEAGRTSLSPLCHASSSGSSSDEERCVMLRVPSPAHLTRSPSGPCVSLAQLRHLESLRRQRLAQEAEALESLPSSLRLARGGAASASGADGCSPGRGGRGGAMRLLGGKHRLPLGSC